MIFKKLFLLIGLFVALHAQANFEIKEQSGSFITFNSAQAQKAWIGLYKKGTSNEWSNVLAWSWVTNTQTKISNISHFHEGDYQARLFFNNSYTTEASIDFHIVQNPGNQEAYLIDSSASPHQKTFQLPVKRTTYAKVNDWVGIFKKGLSHTKENLEAWSYVKRGDKELTMMALQTKGLSVGLYDIVYFTADSYQEDGPTAILTVNIRAKYASGIYQTVGYVLDSYDYITKIQQNKDWIAIFKKEDEPIRKNIIAWSYISEGIFPREDAHSSIIQFPKLQGIFEEFQGEDYKVILFEKDTYKIIKSMTPVSI